MSDSYNQVAAFWQIDHFNMLTLYGDIYDTQNPPVTAAWLSLIRFTYRSMAEQRQVSLRLSIRFLALPRQLYSFPCHFTDSLTLLKKHYQEHPERLVTLETCDESDEETWPDQPKDHDKDKDNDKDKPNYKNI